MLKCNIACSDMSRVRFAGLQFWQIRKASSKIQRSQLVEYADKMSSRRNRYDQKGRVILKHTENSKLAINVVSNIRQ